MIPVEFDGKLVNGERLIDGETLTVCAEDRWEEGEDPLNFQTLTVITLIPGSVVAESVAEYGYANNESQIQFVNTEIGDVLNDILNNTNNLNNIGRAFSNASVQFNGVTLQPVVINNITDLEPFINCTQYANYTAMVINGSWQCVGPCKTNPNYCQHGDCLNQIFTGPVCRCFEFSLQQFYGQRCDQFRWGPGFYGALFGSLAAALLIIIIVVTAVLARRRHTGIWKRRGSFHRRLSVFDEDFFDFSDTSLSINSNLGFPGRYTSVGFISHQENVDTEFQVAANRTEVLNVSIP